MLFSGSLALIFMLLSPFILMEARYRLRQLAKVEEEEVSGFGQILKQIQEGSGFAEIIRDSDLAFLEPVDPEFSVVIPKIGVNTKVIPNVSVEDKKEYQAALKKGAAHAIGSYLPSERGTVLIFGHSTDYIWNVARFNAVFYLLKELAVGDRVSIFYQGSRYEYEVSDRKTVGPNEVEDINKDLSQDRLILQTCWPPGTTWKRLLVIAKPV